MLIVTAVSVNFKISPLKLDDAVFRISCQS